ncbi:MAG TPA: hypothetical protein VE031_07845 [Chthoniobacterales bacterium]|nr:hypothetical protein [Chthoniobacterales bacterium]
MIDEVTDASPNHVQRQINLLASRADGRQEIVIGGVVAENERAPGTLRKRRALRKPYGIDGIKNNGDLLRRHRIIRDQPFQTKMVDGNVMLNAIAKWWNSRPGKSSVTDENAARLGKRRQGRDNFQVLVAVNNLGRQRNIFQAMDDGDSMRTNLVGHGPRPGSVNHRLLTHGGKTESQIARHYLGAEARIEHVIGDENPSTAH